MNLFKVTYESGGEDYIEGDLTDIQSTPGVVEVEPVEDLRQANVEDDSIKPGDEVELLSDFEDPDLGGRYAKGQRGYVTRLSNVRGTMYAYLDMTRSQAGLPFGDLALPMNSNEFKKVAGGFESGPKEPCVGDQIQLLEDAGDVPSGSVGTIAEVIDGGGVLLVDFRDSQDIAVTTEAFTILSSTRRVAVDFRLDEEREDQGREWTTSVEEPDFEAYEDDESSFSLPEPTSKLARVREEAGRAKRSHTSQRRSQRSPGRVAEQSRAELGDKRRRDALDVQEGSRRASQVQKRAWRRDPGEDPYIDADWTTERELADAILSIFQDLITGNIAPGDRQIANRMRGKINPEENERYLEYSSYEEIRGTADDTRQLHDYFDQIQEEIDLEEFFTSIY